MNPRLLRERLYEAYPGGFELEVGADGNVVLTVIHSAFKNLSRSQRLQEVSVLFESTELKPTLVELYTPEEAALREVSVSSEPIRAPAAWSDAVSLSESGVDARLRGNANGPRRVVFYSYKGGVGRTTALLHTAFHLARRGRRVVVVDMDVEAPGIHKLLSRPDGKEVTKGLIDYLWERQVRPEVEDVISYETCLVDVAAGRASAIAYTVEDAVSRAQVHAVPAGAPSSEYVRRLTALSYQDVLTRADDAWTLFEKDLVEQFDPEIMLIDARTGLGDWGGLSLLRLADEVFLVLFPSDQNKDGIQFVRSLLRDVRGIRTNLIVSPIPEGPIGKEIVARVLSEIVEDDEEGAIEVFYTQGIASASVFPVESAMPAYVRIANLVTEAEKESQVEASIGRLNRWGVIESLSFPERDAKTISAPEFDAFFQRTSDFDKFLDDARWVVRGRKGTGKSTLFHLFVEHRENAEKRARGKLSDVIIYPGHGPTGDAQLRPTTDEFQAIQRHLAKNRLDWLSFWRAYAIVRLWGARSSHLCDALAASSELNELRSLLQQKVPSSNARAWRSTDTTAVLALASEPLTGLCRDLLTDTNEALGKEGKKLWLLYDDLDQDIKENSDWQGEALGGLLRLAYDSNNRDLHNIRFKVFLREDIWSKLVFTNKSHFGEPRTVLLQWKIEDFLRLAYRLSTGGSSEFKALAQRALALSDVGVDSASEDELQVALAPLWGLSYERGRKSPTGRWVYSRMTDSRDNTYPRSLTVLLKEARAEELMGRTKAAPSDRLLSPRAMQAGLREASIERVNALKNEYQQLVPFLQAVETKSLLRSQFRTKELEGAWERTSMPAFPTFDAFVATLEDSGLLARKRSNTYDYGFSSLYIDGLGVTRVQGEKK